MIADETAARVTTDFWLATFEIDPAPGASPGPLLAAQSRFLAIEVLRNGEEYAVLFSTANNPQQPTELTCVIGFSNGAKACTVWHNRGFPLVDARIELTPGNGISIVSPCFHDGSSMQYEAMLLTLSGIEFSAARLDPNTSAAINVQYRQVLHAPDGAQPESYVQKRAVTWEPGRSGVVERLRDDKAQVHFDFGSPSVRIPSLQPLKTGPIQPTAVWSGQMLLPDGPVVNKSSADIWERSLKRGSGADAFGEPAFRFEDVEVVGFRIDLGGLGVEQDLARLIAPLNFHLREPINYRTPASKAIPDFRYRAATMTLVIELLRYGRMKSRAPVAPLTLDDHQSQHELMVRLLVGRVDDDTAQAHDPAVYVPAIFVDNPWSKAIGRDLLGFDKRMADFCVKRAGQLERLLPDGRIATPRTALAGPPLSPPNGPVALGEIRHISLAKMTGIALGPPLLDLEFSTPDLTDPRTLDKVDLDLTFGSSSFARTRWRQSDFNETEFRRSFAGHAVRDSAKSFRGIQVAPVFRSDGGLEQTWITGRFDIDNGLRFRLPAGIASLTLHTVPAARGLSTPSVSESWNLLCRMLGGDDHGPARVSLPTGSWYRLFYSMDLTIDDSM